MDSAFHRLAVPLALFLLIAATGPVRATETDAIGELFVRGLDVEVTAIANPAFNGVFARRIYDVTVTRFADNERFSPSTESRVFRSGDRLVPIFYPGSNTELPYFPALLADDLRLTRDTAPDFRAALVGLMPDGFFDAVDGPAVRESDGEWVFPTGKFFDDLKGFVVSVTDDGAVTGVRYSLAL